MTILLSKSGIQKVRNHVPYLVSTDFLESLPASGTLLEFKDERSIISTGYVGQGHRYHACVTQDPINQSFFERHLKAAYQKRLQTFDTLPKAYRLIHNEADGIPGITIEVFLDYIVITYFNRGIINYEKALIQAIHQVIPNQGIYAKYRTPEPELDHTKLINGTAAGEIIIAELSGLYSVRLQEGLMTGLFLDQRQNRIWLKAHAQGKSVCNTFSYTGSLSIACANGKSDNTKSIDLSKTYSEWTKHNLALNNLSPLANEIIVSDTFAHFDYCQRKGIHYDLIILDPPTFAKNKKATFSVPQDYQELAIKASQLLSPKGILFSCTNYSQWSAKQFKQLLQKWMPNSKIIHESGADKDFPKNTYWPESEHLKCVAIQIN